MKRLKRLKRAGVAVVALVVVGCVGGSSAMATTVDPTNTTVTFTSTNFSLKVDPEGSSVNCGHSTMSGLTPVTSGTWTELPEGITYSNCTFGGIVAATVTQSEGCSTTGAGKPTLDVMFSPHPGGMTYTSEEKFTKHAGCDTQITVPSIGCSLTIQGTQTIGNGTSGAGGITLTSGSPAVLNFTSATLPDLTSSGVGVGCPSAGTHSGTYTGTYNSTSAVTLTP
jgi:hypothetical protein